MSVLTLKQKQAKTNVKKKEQDKNKPLKRKSQEVQKQNALGNRAIEEQALNAKGKEVSKEVSSKKELSEKSEIIKTPTDPTKDKAFKAVIRHIKRSGKSQKKPDDINIKESQIKKASVLEVSEQRKNKDQKSHQLSIEKKSEEVDPKKHKFTAKSFKEKFEKQLEVFKDKLPTSKDGVKNFKNTNHLENLETGIKDDTTTSIENVSAPLTGVVLSEKNEKKNNTAKGIVPPQSIPEILLGSTPKPINKKAAIPKPKHPSEISMEKESQSLDTTMRENDLTKEQLKTSNEPEFLEALDLKNEAQKKAAEVPSRYRLEENKTLLLAENKSAMLGKQGFNTMFKFRSSNFGKVHKKQTTVQLKNVQKRRAINSVFEVIYSGIKTAVSNRLHKVTTDTNAFFEKGGTVARAQKTFSENVKDRLEGIYGALDESITFIGRAFGGKSTAQKAKDIFDSEKKQFIETLNSAFDDIAGLIVKGLNDAISYIDTARKVTDAIYKNLDSSEQKLLANSLANMQARYDSLEETVSDKEKELAQSLAKKYKENIDSLKKTFDKIEEDVSANFLEKAYDATIGVAKTILKLKNLILDLFSEIKPFISTIIRSPVSFVKKLFRGIGAGIDLFKDNIKKHVLGGFVKWLTGAMSSMSIDIPDDLFSLKGIFSLVMQVLGLGWDYLRKKSVKLLGEPMVKAMEKGLEMFRVLRSKGIAGIWEHLKEQFNDLKKTIIDEMQSMLITQVLIAGVKWLVGLLIPGGGFIKAIMAIKDLIVFFVESAIMLIPSLISAIKSLASGNVKGVAKAVEKGLSTLIVLVINLFVKLIGLGGLAKKVMKIIERVRKRIDRAIDKLIFKAKKAFKGLVKKGKVKGKSKKGKINKILGEKLTFSAGKENHKLWITNVGGKVKVMVASDNPGVIEKRMKGWERKLTTLEKEKQVKVKVAIGKARVLTNKTMSEAKEEAIITKAILKDKNITSDEVKKESKAEKKTINQEKKLKIYLMELFTVFGYDSPDLLVMYKTEINRLIFKDDFTTLYKKLDEKSVKSIKDWRGFVDLLNNKALHNIIFSKGHKFDTEIRGKNIAKQALNRIQTDKEKKKLWIKYQEDNKNKTEENFISDRIRYIRENIRNSLSNYMLSRNQSTLIKILEIYFIKSLGKKGISEHLDYKPVIQSIKKKSNKFTIKYAYENIEHTKKSFEVNFDFSKIDDNKSGETTQTTLGKNLTLKKSGTRGKTESSGKLMNKSLLYKQFLKDKKIDFEKNETEENLKTKVDSLVDEKGFTKHFKAKAAGLNTLDSNLFDSAHLVADWFSGSGYKDALNLAVTSAEYNRQTMGDAEKSIVTTLKVNEEKPLFNLWVAATWDVLKDSEIMEDVNTSSILKQLNQNSTIKNSDNKALAEQATSALSKVLLAKQDPRRVLQVLYNGKVIRTALSKNKNKKKFKEKIGCDIWMSSYFDFDTDKRCG